MEHCIGAPDPASPAFYQPSAAGDPVKLAHAVCGSIRDRWCCSIGAVGKGAEEVARKAITHVQEIMQTGGVVVRMKSEPLNTGYPPHEPRKGTTFFLCTCGRL